MTKHSEAGKGSSPRPIETDWETYSDNWDRIFGKKTKEVQKKEEQPNSLFQKQSI